MLLFRHAGDIGDIIYALPAMRALGGGALLIEAAAYTRQRLTPDKWCGVNELLLRQSYVQDVRQWIVGEPVNYNLNDFRARMMTLLRVGHGHDKHLGYWICESHGVPFKVMDDQWLHVADPIDAAKVVFSRSGAGRDPRFVYHNPHFPWHKVWAKYRDDAVFVGTEDEHRYFVHLCGDVPHYRTNTLLEAARVIAGAKLFIGNQSAPHAIAEGLKKRIVLEVWPTGPNCLMNDPGRVTHGWDLDVQLPDL